MAHETQLLSALDPFFQRDLITDVLHVVKSGKEASVYCCQAHPKTGIDLIAAKIYRPREQRDFKDDSVYQAGRHYGSTFGRAVAAKNKVGMAHMYGMWIDAEYETLHLLYHAGCDVPRPMDQVGSAMLIEYIGDRNQPAPLLHRIKLDLRTALPLFRRLMHNIEVWLACDRIHGDLSPFNILYWNGELKVIDFPQAVHPQVNPHAYDLLRRDIDRVCDYFARCGVRSDPRRITDDLWVRYQFGGLQHELA